MKLVYEAYDAGGRLVKDRIDAADAGEATEQLRKRGLFVSRIEPERSTSSRSARVRGGGSTGAVKHISEFARQLSILIGTGTPLVEGLGAIERQAPPGAWRDTVRQVRERVEEGLPLAVAMSHHPRMFDPVSRSLVAAGESSGQLKPMLERLGMMMRQQLKVRHSLVGAMTYPSVLMGISVLVLVVMVIFVLPRFEGLFSSLGAPPPPSTQFLLDLSSTVTTYWYACLAGVVAIGGLGWWWVGSAVGRAAIGHAAVSAPVVGKLVRSVLTARIARLLGVLLESKVPLLESLALTRESAGNARYAAVILEAEEGITQGESIAPVLKRSGLFSETFVEALQTGERTGKMGPVLLGLAEAMDEDNEVVVKSITTVIEPLILLVLGGVVGFVAYSMFMPLLDVTSLTQGAAP